MKKPESRLLSSLRNAKYFSMSSNYSNKGWLSSNISFAITMPSRSRKLGRLKGMLSSKPRSCEHQKKGYTAIYEH
jgi:hypothetical protein